MQSKSPERWIAWVRRVCVEDGDMPYDDAEEGVTSFLTNPRILWSTANAHNVEIYAPIPTDARVRQNYGAYVPYNMPSLSDYSLRARVTDSTDNYTDVAEKEMRVHFPIEEWQQFGEEYHPVVDWVERGEPYALCLTKVALGLSPQTDWVYYSQEVGPTTFQKTESCTVSLAVTGTIQLQPGVTVGNDIVKFAFHVNAGATLGATFTKASGTSRTWQVPAGQVWRFFWGYAHRVLWGRCDIYEQEGYAGTCDWHLLEWAHDPSGTVPIVWAYYVVPTGG